MDPYYNGNVVKSMLVTNNRHFLKKIVGIQISRPLQICILFLFMNNITLGNIKYVLLNTSYQSKQLNFSTISTKTKCFIALITYGNLIRAIICVVLLLNGMTINICNISLYVQMSLFVNKMFIIINLSKLFCIITLV